MANSVCENAWKTFADRGIAAQERGDYAGALVAHRQAVELNPDAAATQNNLGCILHLLGRDIEAKVHYLRALELNPEQVEVLCNLGTLSRDAGEFELALDYFNRAVACDRNHARSRLQRGLTRIQLGDFSGWDDYEEREAPVQLPLSSQWKGESLAGKTLAILTEQTLGDEIMLASTYPDLIGQGVRLLVLCTPRLEKIFRRSFPQARVIGGASFEEYVAKAGNCSFDAWSWSGGLLKFLRRSHHDFPRHQGYLSIAAENRARWQAQRSGESLNVGISWAGGLTPEEKRSRSTMLEMWRPILKVPGVQFVTLQPGNVAPDLKALGKLGRQIQLPGASPLGDMADYADFIASLDLVITVDNTLAHLSGALGLPTWMLTAKVANWRWGTHSKASLWYPSVRLFRQDEQFEWQPVMEEIAVELQQTASARNNPLSIAAKQTS